jgi:hypothetical protein
LAKEEGRKESTGGGGVIGREQSLCSILNEKTAVDERPAIYQSEDLDFRNFCLSSEKQICSVTFQLWQSVDRATSPEKKRECAFVPDL